MCTWFWLTENCRGNYLSSFLQWNIPQMYFLLNERQQLYRPFGNIGEKNNIFEKMDPTVDPL